MDDSAELNGIANLNYRLLVLLQASALGDPMLASCQFGVDRQVIEAIRGLSPEYLYKLVLASGDQSLFILRPDFGRLLGSPIHSLSVLLGSAARPNDTGDSS